jgi:hypothetical protein
VRGITPAHAAIALLVAVVLPLGSRLGGSGMFAWTMFSKTEMYRLRVEGTRRDGVRRDYDPAALGPYLTPNARHFLPEKDLWRHDPVALTFRTSLRSMARLACRLDDLASTELTFEERATLDAPPRLTTASATCDPPP